MKNKQPNYFLISVSNQMNLDLCIKHSMAGFTNSINGLWTFLDINEGDYISFLYGARVRNLYQVVKKVAYKNAENLPPWPPITFKVSGNTYYFPFRLFLKPERKLDESMVKPEFSYVAENLLLRGGYKKTHFQADAITFYNVSERGIPYNDEVKLLDLGGEVFEPKIVFRNDLQKIPERFYFRELILQSLIRKKLQNSELKKILDFFEIKNSSEEFEVLGEKALPEGFVDLFIKLKHPSGSNKYILVEVKTGTVYKKDVEQLKSYVGEFRGEAIGGVLISRNFSKSLNYEPGIMFMSYYFENIDRSGQYKYEDLLKSLTLEPK